MATKSLMVHLWIRHCAAQLAEAKTPVVRAISPAADREPVDTLGSDAAALWDHGSLPNLLHSPVAVKKGTADWNQFSNVLFRAPLEFSQ